MGVSLLLSYDPFPPELFDPPPKPKTPTLVGHWSPPWPLPHHHHGYCPSDKALRMTRRCVTIGSTTGTSCGRSRLDSIVWSEASFRWGLFRYQVTLTPQTSFDNGSEVKYLSKHFVHACKHAPDSKMSRSGRRTATRSMIISTTCSTRSKHLIILPHHKPCWHPSAIEVQFLPDMYKFNFLLT